MSDALRDLEVLALDCQAGGATPAHGDLLELGWALCSARGALMPVRSNWIRPRTQRPIPRPIRELTGWTEASLVDALDEREVWLALQQNLGTWTALPSPAPTVIHFARFELPFLRDLHERLGPSGAFPFDAICLHAAAARLLPELPRRNIRALAGYFGHSPELVRRSAGHVQATAQIWTALLPLLEAVGVRTWSELKAWLAETTTLPRAARRTFPLAPEQRRALPDSCGVYRFLRGNGDVIYVGKATSLKKRVASHFKTKGPATERALELLTQVQSVEHTETSSLLEAALLESDEIKRLDPPYNVQLRSTNRSAWFASRDLREAVSTVDELHPNGPLPSERAVAPLAALISLAEGADRSKPLLSCALAVPSAFLPEPSLFQAGWELFRAEHLSGGSALTAGGRSNPESEAFCRVTSASLALWLARGRAEPEPATEDTAPDSWDLPRVRRRLERNLVQSGLLLRRARWLCLLADATIAFRERGMSKPRLLVLSATRVTERAELDSVSAIAELTTRRPRKLAERKRSLDAGAYDRVRVLLTELRRVLEEGGEVAMRLGAHTLSGDRLAQWMRSV
jgi:DNA polymerase-3 subunit epsilon